MNPSSLQAVSPTSWIGPPPGSDELQNAGKVQARLRPRDLPRMATLDYAGSSLPGRALGGDFYDFLPAGPGRLALLLGDVSGHGVPAALLMAALQASLRTHYAVGSGELRGRIEAINRLFYDCTAAEHYAGLFIAEYDDGSRRLDYANCGHVAPLVVHRGGELERLESTGTPLGMFAAWNGSLGQIALAPGDLLVLVTDGVVEATDRGEAEYGEPRLASSILRNRRLAPEALVRAVARDVRLTCGRRPADDATVVVARVRESTGAADGSA